MSWFAVVLVVAVVAGIVGVALAKVDELSGVGREHEEGSFRWKHGRLLRTQVLNAEEEPTRVDLAKKVLLPSIVVAAVCSAAMFVPALSGYGNVATVVSLGASVAIATAVRGDKGDYGRAFAYAICGLVLACTMLVLVAQAYAEATVAEVNAFTTLFGAVGASVGAVALPARIVFAREFADGAVNFVRMSGRTTAASLLVKLEDESWVVPTNVRESAKRLVERGR